ncbi:hypothetical protein IJI31_00095 [bacterium]|nr:hypothetical protein [bacterium]
MNINAINNTGFKGYLQVNNKTKINTDTIQEIRKNPWNEKVEIWYQDEKYRLNYPKVQILNNADYQNVLNAYTAASQNPNVVIDI